MIKPTINYSGVLAIANELKEYFSEDGLKQIEKDTQCSTIFGAYDGAKMVGFVMYKKLNSQAVEMLWLGVLPSYQGGGIGGILVNESLRCIGDSYKICEVKTLSESDDYEPYQKTREFYKRLGFISLETINPYPGWIDPCQIFVKSL